MVGVSRGGHAFRINPRLARAHNNMGEALARQGSPEVAIEHFRRALEIDPSFADAQNNWGSILVQQGRFTEAIEHFRRALARPRLYRGSAQSGSRSPRSRIELLLALRRGTAFCRVVLVDL